MQVRKRSGYSIELITVANLLRSAPIALLLNFGIASKIRGQSHPYSSKQKLRFNPDGCIIRIDHEEIPGEREKLDAF